MGFLGNKFFPLGKVKKYNDLYLIMFFFLLFVLVVLMCSFNVKQLLEYYNDI